MTAAGLTLPPVRPQPLQAVNPQAVEELVAAGPARPRHGGDHRLAHQGREVGEEVAVAAGRLGCFHAELPDEHRQALEQLALGRREQLVAPVDGRAQRAVPASPCAKPTSMTQLLVKFARPGSSLWATPQLRASGADRYSPRANELSHSKNRAGHTR